MEEPDDYYIANNKGQEAFQLFYERLLELKREYLRDKNLLLNNAFHLTTIITTFNRNYCYGISTIDTTEAITPIYLNFKVEGTPSYTLHRLLSIYLKCDKDDNARRNDTFIFIFDNPIEDNQQKIIIDVTIDDFTRLYYKKEIYSFDKRNYREISLNYDNVTNNFYYEYEDDELHGNNIINTYNHGSVSYGYPPIFSDFIYYEDDNAEDLTYIDNSGIYKLMDNGDRWKPDKKYIATNRYIDNKEYKPLLSFPESYSHSSFKASTDDIMLFLFGIRDMVYVFENFNNIDYNPVTEIDIVRAVIDSNPFKQLNKILPCYITLKPKDKKRYSELQGQSRKYALIYTQIYERLNNTINSIVYSTNALTRLIATIKGITTSDHKNIKRMYTDKISKEKYNKTYITMEWSDQSIKWETILYRHIQLLDMYDKEILQIIIKIDSISSKMKKILL